MKIRLLLSEDEILKAAISKYGKNVGLPYLLPAGRTFLLTNDISHSNGLVSRPCSSERLPNNARLGEKHLRRRRRNCDADGGRVTEQMVRMARPVY